MNEFPVGTVEPDSRGRVAIKKHMTKEPVLTWQVYRSEDGRTIRLEAVVA